MKPSIRLIIVLVISFTCISYSQTKIQPHKTKVMTLGVFHFDYPNLDVKKTSDKDKIDVLAPEYQEEIKRIAAALEEFKPTQIFVEAGAQKQKKIDSLYNTYKEGKYNRGRNEVEQLGFRLAKQLNLNEVNCIDTWGKLYESLNYLLSDTSSRAKAFEKYYFNNPDTVYSAAEKSNSADSKNIISDLIKINYPQRIKESLGSYLIGHFKYEEKEGDYTGADFEAGRWFDRNLRIFRNVQRHITKDTDRILVIFGAGHMNVLNYLFECSPEFELVSPEPYLRKAARLE